MRLKCLTPAIAALWLTGCATTLPGGIGGSDGLLDQRVRLAEKEERRGNIPRALFHWRVAEALAPGDRRVEQNIERLDKERRDEAQRLRAAGGKELSHGKTWRAGNTLLKALALDPTDEKTRQLLRKLEQRRLEGRMRAKVESSRQALALADKHGEAGGNAEEMVYISSEKKGGAGRHRDKE